MQQEDSNDNSADIDVEAHANMALQLYQEGHLQQAQDECLRLLRKQQRPDVILILAKIAHEQREFEVAVERYQQFLGIIPDHEQTHFYLGVVLEELGHIERAIEHYRKSISIAAGNAAVHRQLGASLQKIAQTTSAVKCFEESLRLRPDYFGARIDLARALRQFGKAEEARILLEEAIELKPDNEEAHIDLALTLRQLGHTELAKERLEHFLTIQPACGRAYYHISMINPKQELIPVVEKLLAGSGLPKSETIYCGFAMGNFLDSGKFFDEAFKHFLKGNTLKRETFTYDARENSQTVNRLIKVYSSDFFQEKQKFGSDSRLPVFIVGMPRSGTTLVEQIISSHSLVHGAGEVEAFPGVNRAIAQRLNHAEPAPECMSLIDRKIAEKYSARYLQELTLRCPTATRITDKLPGNFVRIGLIKTLFPNARIIHCQRNPLDNCVSLFFHCFTALTCSFELTELGQYYLDYQRLMSHWQKLFPGEIFNLQYEELVMDQESISKQLIAYLGLEWDKKCIDFHNNERNFMSPSNMLVRQPIYKSSMNRWKLYEKQLQPLIEVLQAGEESI